MVSVTLSIPEDVKKKMEKFSEINWSGFIRKQIIEKTEEISLKEELLNKLEKERGLIDWSVELGRKAKKDSFRRLLSEVSPKRRGELLKAMPPEKRREYK